MRSQLNALRFAVRSAIGFRRGPPTLLQEPKQDLFDYLEVGPRKGAERRETELRRRYELEPLLALSTRFDYRDNVYWLDALERLLGDRTLGQTDATSAFRVVDVGSKNFNYAFALERFFRNRVGPGRALALVGIELDGHVIYRDWRSRCDYAEAYARQTENPGVVYRVADFAALKGETFDVATLLFPFVTEAALVRWGLPLRFFEPKRLLAKAIEVTPKGYLFVFSQTEAERDALVELVAEFGVEVSTSVAIAGRLVHYHEDASERFGTLLRVH